MALGYLDTVGSSLDWFDGATSRLAWFDKWLAQSFPVVATPGVGPAGAASFVLGLEGLGLTLSWVTNVLKATNGLEQRISLLGAPRQRYAGAARLVDAEERTVRAALLTDAAQAQPYLIALPYEDLPLTSDASGTTINVPSTALCDWAQAGQRVLVVGPTGTVASAVVQSAGATTIVVDPDVSAVAKKFGRIMPAMAVYLEPSQGMRRALVNVGYWDLAARAALFGYANVEAMGVGAAVTTYLTFPVYDYRNALGDELAANGIRTLGEILDAGGLPLAVGGADVVDLIREIRIDSSSHADWQWFKKFLFTVRGRQCLFLLPTWQPDLVFHSNPGGLTLLVKSADTPGAGDYLAYFNASQAQLRLQVLKTDGSVQYVSVNDVFDNLDGTLTLDLDATVTGTVAMISFLETVRLESDDVEITWQAGWEFSSTLVARVVQQ